MTAELDLVKIAFGFIATIGTTVWAVYKIWFKASTNDFVTKSEMQKFETEIRKDITDLSTETRKSLSTMQTSIAKMEGDLKTHIEVTKQHNVFVQKQLDRLEESNKDLKHEFNKNFDHLISNIKQWNESKEYHKLTAKIAEKIGVSAE